MFPAVSLLYVCLRDELTAGSVLRYPQGGPGSPSKQTPTWDGAKQRGNKARSVSPLGVLCPGRGSRHGSRLLTPRDTPGDEGRTCLMNIDPVYMHSILRFSSIFWLRRYSQISSVHAQQLWKYLCWHVNQHSLNKPEMYTTSGRSIMMYVATR